jgi:hypothetical protein
LQGKHGKEQDKSLGDMFGEALKEALERGKSSPKTKNEPVKIKKDVWITDNRACPIGKINYTVKSFDDFSGLKFDPDLFVNAASASKWENIQYNIGYFTRHGIDHAYEFPPPWAEPPHGHENPIFTSPTPRPDSLFLGVIARTFENEPLETPQAILHNRQGHLLTIAPTRAGKGTGQIIPSLMHYVGSALVVDIKGENYAVTGEHRASGEQFQLLAKAAYGGLPESKVFRFAPFEENTARFNPLDFIREGDDAYDDARMVADMLIPTGPRSGDEFWANEAKNALTALLVFVVHHFREDGAATLRTLLELCSTQGEAHTGPDGQEVKITAFARILERMENAGPDIATGWAVMFRGYPDKMQGSIWGTMAGALSIWRSARLLNATDASDFRCEDLRRKDGPTTVYLCFPPEYLQSHKAVLRVLVGLAVATMTRPDLGRPPVPTAFILDEAPALGYMAPILQAQAYLAGYGIKLWTFSQSISQLQAAYGEAWQTFTANADVICTFGINDLETSQWVSRMLGSTGEYLKKYKDFEYRQHWNGLENSRPDPREDNEDKDQYNEYFEEWWGRMEKNREKDHMGNLLPIGQYEEKYVVERERWTSEPIAEPNSIRSAKGIVFAFPRGMRPVLFGLAPYYKSGFFRGAKRWTP